MKLLSLFDGSGGFPLAASMCGIEPIAASEVEPYPIAVTRSRFPNMNHLGSVTDIKGDEIEPVDVFSFGSPCQDLSIAGCRAGLKHTETGAEETTRSGLFMEAIRIIKEMRGKTNGKYPRFAVWENVPGAFSSNKGADFRTVLEEFIKIVEKDAVMPSVPEAGWAYADCYRGDGWSIAYRTFDAQYWGVPQRRRRIYLVADFRGERAGEILFEREGLRGYFAEGRTPWQTASCDLENGTRADDRETIGVDIYNGQTTGGIATTLTANTGTSATHSGPTVLTLADVASTLRAGAGAPKHEQDYVGRLVVEKDTLWKNGPISFHLTQDPISNENVSHCISAGSTTGAAVVGCAYSIENQHAIAYNQHAYDEYIEHEVGCTLKALGGNYGGGSENLAVEHQETQYIVRRLTPTECARLQGFPDTWGHPDKKDDFTDEEYAFWLEVRNTHAAINDKQVKEYTKEQILNWYNKLHTDSAEYKMWGNGIALPNALYVMQGIAEVLRRGNPKMINDKSERAVDDMLREEEAKRTGYLMPCTAVEKLSVHQQICRTNNELIEVWDAYDVYTENNCQPQYRKALLMECVDVQVCMETLMHNLGADETERAEMRRAVWEKNNARGYYDEG